MYKNWLFVCFCLKSVFLAKAVRQSHFQSPCPNIFQYFYDNSGVLYGNIQVTSSNDSFIQLTIQLSVGNNVEGYNGKIELVHSKAEVLQQLINRRPIKYKLNFPMWNRIPPKIIKILVNGALVCSGSKIDISLVPVLTTINLQHSLKINVPSGVSTTREPHVNSLEPNLRRDNDRQYHEEDYFYHSPTTQKINDVQPQMINFNFNPKPPKNTTKIYSFNPFFRNPITSTTKKTPTTIESRFTDCDEHKDVDSLPARSSADVETLQFPVENDVDEEPSVDLNLVRTPFGGSCGRPIATNPLVVNGSPVARGAYPWLAALFVSKNLGPEFRCTGTLITQRHVITAGHCVKDGSKVLQPDDVLVILGKMNIKKWTRDDYERLVYADSLHVHPDYDSSTADADIAIVRLLEKVDFSIYIRPVCLWTEPNDLDLVVGEKGVVVGWGRSETGAIVTSEPRMTVLPIVGQEQCLRSMYTFQYITSERTFCAGFRNGSGPCNGDSGGGFIIKRKDRWVLRGVVSMSLSDQVFRNCDLKNYVVFSDASKFTQWILSFVK